MDNRLRWNSHIKKASSNLSKKVKQLKRMRSLPADILETIYFCVILPSATYGMGIWGSCSLSLLEELEKVHRRAARIIHKIPKQVPRCLILDEAKWKPVSYHSKKRIACLTHQAYYRKHPDVINGLVVKHLLNRILTDNLEVRQSKTNVGRCSFRHRAAIIWNSLPEVVKVHGNYEVFKKKLSKCSKVLDNICFNESSIVTFKDTNTFYYN